MHVIYCLNSMQKLSLNSLFINIILFAVGKLKMDFCKQVSILVLCFPLTYMLHSYKLVYKICAKRQRQTKMPLESPSPSGTTTTKKNASIAITSTSSMMKSNSFSIFRSLLILATPMLSASGSTSSYALPSNKQNNISYH